MIGQKEAQAVVAEQVKLLCWDCRVVGSVVHVLDDSSMLTRLIVMAGAQVSPVLLTESSLNPPVTVDKLLVPMLAVA